MALDIYVGTLTRYYRQEWENKGQRLAREQGWEHSIIRPGGDVEPPQPAVAIRKAVAGWRVFMTKSLAPHGIPPITWDEGDEKPYFTERPTWPGYCALLVWAAHSEHPDLPAPHKVPESWVEDVAFQRSTSTEFKTRFRTILQPSVWVPGEFPFVFGFPTLASDKESCVGSVFTLKTQLDDLHARTFRQQEILVAAAQTPPAEASELAVNAQSVLTIFRDLANKACEHRLPLLLDF
jgi:hypothetical protein